VRHAYFPISNELKCRINADGETSAKWAAAPPTGRELGLRSFPLVSPGAVFDSSLRDERREAVGRVAPGSCTPRRSQNRT
jgi:hypothetical protein